MATKGSASSSGRSADVLERWETADGTRFLIRPLRADDGARELTFLRSLSEQALYERTFSRRGALKPGELRRLTRFDVREEIALVAIAGHDPDGEFAAVARLKKLPDRSDCEFAIVVGDQWQRRGVGIRLLDRLVDVARRAGIERVIGYTFATNEAMKALARKAGFTTAPDPQDRSVALLSIDLRSPAPEAPDGRPDGARSRPRR